MRVLVDFHHSSLLRSLILLFERRLGMEVYRPIGMDWFKEGYWKINDQLDTAKQYLSLSQAYKPGDGTPALNALAKKADKGVYYCLDPGGRDLNRACMLHYVMNHKFDYLVASIPEHIEPFKRLIKLYQPQAKLIFQVGNDWNFEELGGMNVLASTLPREVPADVNVKFYHQEFDLAIFSPYRNQPRKTIFSFINILHESAPAWSDFTNLEGLLGPAGFEFRSFGGQCRDGNMDGPYQLAKKMRRAQFVFHVKPGGDGFGHVIHNAYAMGRPVITRSSHYKGKLASLLLEPGTFIDLDELNPGMAARAILDATKNRVRCARMGQQAYERFRQVVDYKHDADGIREWLKTLK